MLVAENFVQDQVKFNQPPIGVDDEKYLGNYHLAYDDKKETMSDSSSDDRDDSVMESKMPLPTMLGVPPTNLLPSDPSMSEISSLLLPSASEAIRPRPVQLPEEDQWDDDEPVQLNLTSDDENYVKLDEVEEVSLLTACGKTNWGQMIKSRFFLFFLITVPTVVIPCCFLPFAFFQVDHIFLFIFMIFPAFFIYIYFYPEEDEVFIDDFSDFDIEDSEDSADELLNNGDMEEYDPDKVYSF